MSQKLANFIATYCGLGLAPKAPGTVGSIGTIPLAFLLAFYTGVYGIIIASIIIFVIGTVATDVIIRDQIEKDPGKVVVDEVVGQLLTFIFVADILYQNLHAWHVYIFGLIAFRFFDIYKMGPVKWCDRHLKNAYGVMLDDIFAGIMAAIALWGFNLIYHKFG